MLKRLKTSPIRSRLTFSVKRRRLVSRRSCEMSESPPSGRPDGNSASAVIGPSNTSQRPVGLFTPHATPSEGMLWLYARMSGFSSSEVLKRRPSWPKLVPGRYERNVPVPERSTSCGRKALNGRPLNAVEMNETFQLPSTLRFAQLLLVEKKGTSQTELRAKR